MIVVDTNVLIHLFNDTNLNSIANKILDKDPIWITSSIWQEEYANFLAKFTLTSGKSTAEVCQHYQDVLDQMAASERNIDKIAVLRTAVKYKIRAHDAHFLTLAQEFMVPLITEDKQVLKNCPQIALSMAQFTRV